MDDHRVVVRREAIGRSRGGLATKIHAIVDALGNPLAVSLTGGHVHDVKQAQVLTQKIEPATLLVYTRHYNPLRPQICMDESSKGRCDEEGGKIEWRFSTDDARIKLERLYPSLQG